MDLADGMIPIAEHFGELEDPRRGRAKRHELLDLIVITLCAVVCGADNWVEIEEFGKAKREWFERFLKLPNGIPSHDTFGRVFGMLDSERFAACFTQWVQSVSQLAQGEMVAIDGKTLRGARPSQRTGCPAPGERLGHGEPDGIGAGSDWGPFLCGPVEIDEAGLQGRG